MATATKKGYSILSQKQLNQMKARANLVEQSDPAQTKDLELYQQSQERTSKWADNYKDLKKRKQDERFKKFQKEELERRKIDQEERGFQQVVRESELKKANEKLFQNDERVRALNSKLLMSDTLQGREEQMVIKDYVKDIEKKREQYYHQETLNQVKQKQEEQKKKKEEQKRKLKDFQKGIRKQHKQLKKNYIQDYKNQMQEGELLKLKAEEAIRQEEEKQKQKRTRAMKNNVEVNRLNADNKKLKQKQLEKQREEEFKIEQFRKNKEAIEDLNKKQRQELIDIKIRQREKLYKKQAQKLSKIENKEVERLNKQIQQLQKKEQDIQRKKDEQKKILKDQYEQSLKDQLEKRRLEKQKQKMDNEHFKGTWNSKLNNLKDIDNQDDQIRRNMLKKNQDDLKRQMDEKQKNRENNYRRQLDENDKAKGHLEEQEEQFRSYAEKCTKQWSDNGKNLYPIIKHLTSTMKK